LPFPELGSVVHVQFTQEPQVALGFFVVTFDGGPHIGSEREPPRLPFGWGHADVGRIGVINFHAHAQNYVGVVEFDLDGDLVSEMKWVKFAEVK
jgi:hypothetical protein